MCTLYHLCVYMLKLNPAIILSIMLWSMSPSLFGKRKVCCMKSNQSKGFIISFLLSLLRYANIFSKLWRHINMGGSGSVPLGPSVFINIVYLQVRFNLFVLSISHLPLFIYVCCLLALSHFEGTQERRMISTSQVSILRCQQKW